MTYYHPARPGLSQTLEEAELVPSLESLAGLVSQQIGQPVQVAQMRLDPCLDLALEEGPSLAVCIPGIGYVGWLSGSLALSQGDNDDA